MHLRFLPTRFSDARARVNGRRAVQFEGPLAKCDVKCEFGFAKFAHKRAKCEGPPPLAIDRMLGSSRRRRQANPCREVYNFSLVIETDIRLSFRGTRNAAPVNP